MPYKDPVKRKAYHREYYKKWAVLNRDKIRAAQRRYAPKKKLLRFTPKVKKQLREVRYRRHHRNKVWVFEHYGKCCVYCGCDKYEHLAVDHINDDGAEERKGELYKKTNLGGMYGFLASNKIIDKTKYQILCHNCNAAKQYYKLIPNEKGVINYKPFEYWKTMSKLRNNKLGESNEKI